MDGAVLTKYLYMQFKNLSLILFMAYLFFNTKYGNVFWEKSGKELKGNRAKRWKMVALFSGFTLYATFAVSGDGSNMRLIGPFLAGYIGGVRFGLIISLAGVLGLIIDEFYFLYSPPAQQVGNLFYSAIVTTLLAGWLAGVFHRFYSRKYISIIYGMIFVFFFELIIHWGVTLILASPFALVWRVTKEAFIIMVPAYVLGFGAFLLMLKSMEEEREMRVEKSRIESELFIASKIQKSFLPAKKLRNEHFSVAAELSSYRAIGGEFYDFYLQEDKLIFIVGNIEAKGAVSALGMVLSKALFSFKQFSDVKPDMILRTMNEMLCDYYAKGDFSVRAFVGVYDRLSKCLCYVNAAHACPYHYTVAGTYRKVEGKDERALGVFREINLVNRELQMSAGDCLVLLSGLQTGEKMAVRMNEFLQDEVKGHDAEIVLQKKFTLVQSWLAHKHTEKNVAALVLCIEGRN